MITKEIKIFYQFLLASSETQTSYVISACTKICKPKYLAIDRTGKCHAFSDKPTFDGRFWQPSNKHKVYIFTLPKQVTFVASETLKGLKKA